MSSAHFGCVAGIEVGGHASLSWLLAELGGKTWLEQVVARARAASLVDEVWVLPAAEGEPRELFELLEAQGIPFLPPEPGDALERALSLGERHRARHLVCLDARRPLLDPDFIDLQLGALRAFDADFVRLPGSAEAGASAFHGQRAVSMRALRRLQASAEPADRAALGEPFFLRAPELFETVELEFDPRLLGAFELPLADAAGAEALRELWRAVDHEGDGSFPTARALRWWKASGASVR